MTEIHLCPCRSGLNYSECCGPFHKGAHPKTALQLMRSRYAAYALKLADYIILTTHPSNPQYNPDIAAWTQEILQFCMQTQFVGLEIVEAQEKSNQATIIFQANLMQGTSTKASFVEKSKFEKLANQWLYKKCIWMKPVD